ncbi:hypothetical protein ACFL7M_12335 [Thermodesulfobacteriota bacterium]
MGLSKGDNFIIECEIEKVDGVNNNGYGIAFGIKDLENSYHFLINGNGDYLFTKSVNGKIYDIRQWSRSQYINKYNAENNIKIRKRNSVFEFFINDHLVYETKHEDPPGTKVGFKVNKKQSVNIKNIIVKRISSM